MTSSKKDLRFVKTRNNILKAMITLLQEKSFDKITVKDICLEANISRSGFYLHYVDKYDLVETYQRELMKRGTELFEENMAGGPKAIMTGGIEFMQQEGQLLALMLSKNGAPEIQEKIKQLFQENAKKNILPHLQVSLKSETEEKYLIAFLSGAIVSVLQEWINNGQKESAEEVVAFLEQILAVNFV